ncbi:beta-N-acetylhexosaminidase [Saccharobesus litoralis]|uniref:beta-N-acetylhexosaminidase n=1 Tax=Saccharobesus litoralis TaxID=2172099 RepID=A0A2S0VV13_9ALTE|nr:family 20 glycosylhydrolase [Saccharobesus litoralis]AWB68064.1 beta-N-acetylhexosaminidase [Saccharobesus litoralis]
MQRLGLLLTLSIFALSACKSSRHNPVQRLAEQLAVQYQVITNRADETCPKQYAGGACFQGQISLQLPYEYTNSDWQIYFSHVAPIRSESSELFDIIHINGDLHKIQPTAAFNGFLNQQTYKIQFKADYWHLSNFDAIPNYFIVSGEGQPELIRSTKARIDQQTGQEILPFVKPISDYESQFKRTPDDKTLWATPQNIYQANADRLLDEQLINIQPSTGLTAANRVIPNVKQQQIGQGFINLQRGFSISAQDQALYAELRSAFFRLNLVGFNNIASGLPLTFERQSQLPVEAYQLDITKQGIKINYTNLQGAFYAIQTLANLIDIQDSSQLAVQKITDEPRYDFRGLHIDVSRNFHGVNQIKKLIREMSAYKLNSLHLHLGDDEGWRVEIPGLPELTELGANRCFDPQENQCLQAQLGSGPYKQTQVNGFYSVDEYIDLLKYAKAHFVTVLPSFDMPGHSRAAIKAMEKRYRDYMAKGQTALATEYLLSDFADKTQYESVQFYSDNTINVCMPSALHFVDKVVSELAQLHRQAGVKLDKYHIGADETAGAWVKSPICQQLMAQDPSLTGEKLGARFVEQVANQLAQKGIKAAAWSDGLSHANANNLPNEIQSNVWSTLFWNGHQTLHDHINKGWQVVVSNPDVTYFDFPYEAHPDERGYYWASRATNTYKVFQFMPDNTPAMAEVWHDRQNQPYSADDSQTSITNGQRAAGLQAHLWSETTRLDVTVDYLLFPRLLALAERAWHQADWELAYQPNRQYSQQSGYLTQQDQQQRDRDWQMFNQALSRELAKLEKAQVQYRVATPGAKLQAGQLYMNHILPKTQLQYRINQGAWQDYNQPVKVNGQVEVRAKSQLGTFYSRTEAL